MVKIIITESQFKHLIDETFVSYLPNKMDASEKPANIVGNEIEVDGGENNTFTNDEFGNKHKGNNNYRAFGARRIAEDAESHNSSVKKPFLNKTKRNELNQNLKNGQVNQKHQKFINHLANGNVSDEALRQANHRAKVEKQNTGNSVFGDNIDSTINRGFKQRAIMGKNSTQPKNSAITGLRNNPNKSHHKDDYSVNIT